MSLWPHFFGPPCVCKIERKRRSRPVFFLRHWLRRIVQCISLPKNNAVAAACASSIFCFVFTYFCRFLSDKLSENPPTDLRQIFRVGRTVAVDDKSEISCSIPQGHKRTLPRQPIFVDFIRTTEFR